MQLLGLVDTLEAIILKSRKIPMTDKVVLEEKKLLNLIDKIRLVIKQGEGVIRKSIEKEIEEKKKRQSDMDPVSEAQKIINEAYSKARQVRDGADEYADQVLANLQIIISKIKRNTMKMDQILENGRDRLKKTKELDDKAKKIINSREKGSS